MSAIDIAIVDAAAYLCGMNIQEIIAENKRRNKLLAQQPYDPLTGEGCCGERLCRDGVWLPRTLLDECPHFSALSDLDQRRLRIIHDFEYWCATCVIIRDKLTGRPMNFHLNKPQRRLLAIMEEQRIAGLPVRIILLKARQWGGSTLVQMYMAWMQIVRHKGWNSLICGHLKQSARAIKGMYSLLLRNYPQEMLDEDEKLKFKNFEGSREVQSLESRDCLVITGTAVSDDAVRGYNLAMAHLTEVAFWPDTPQHSPEDVMRSVNGTITRMPESVIVLESTANGVGQFFHDEWIRAQAGDSDKIPVFVPWHEIEIYRSAVRDPKKLWDSMDEYERTLWYDGLTLEMIQWYHDKRRETSSHAAMMAEFPTNSSEAFICSGFSVFDSKQLDQLRRNCRPPRAVGEMAAVFKTLKNLHFQPVAQGKMNIWEFPKPGTKYIVAVDVGGRTPKADYSVIAVFDVTDIRNRPIEVVAQWRGHIDHDLLAWEAAQVAAFYNKALLVVEANTFIKDAASEYAPARFVLDEVSRYYRNVYWRDCDKMGFHTNTHTKPEIIGRLIADVRDEAYIEHDHEAVNEMMTYEQHGAAYRARKGHHDDILMTRAIALWVARKHCALQRTTITDADKKALISPNNHYP
ncbi:MAG: hypothetical protein J6S96_04550 [Muribaculaceae bacterium]|nr:hypothetical protein [Muribaculaceae bacterium]